MPKSQLQEQTSAQAWGKSHEIALAAADGDNKPVPPEWVHLLGLGSQKMRDSRQPFNLVNAQAVVAASMAEGRDLPIDFNHQTDTALKSGGEARAAGWIKELAARPDGIWGRAEWTERGAQALAGQEYRHISPTFDYAVGSRDIIRINRAGLVNNPALTLTALAAEGGDMADKENSPETKESERQALAVELGLDEQSNMEQILGQVKSLKALAAAQGVPDSVAAKPPAPDSAAMKNAAPDPGQFAPVADLKAINDELTALKAERAREKAEQAVAAAMAAGQLSPAQKSWGTALATQDPASFEAFLKDAPTILTANGAPTAPPLNHGGGDAQASALCTALGISLEDFKKTHENEAGQAVPQ